MSGSLRPRLPMRRLRDDANQTVTKLRELVGDIQHSAETINVAAKE